MRAILLVDHGSRVASANAVVTDVAASLQATLGPAVLVAHAHQESAPPSIDVAIDALVARGATEILVVPFFLAPGRHATEDVPRLVREAAARHPSVRVETTAPPLPGAVSELAAIVQARALR